MSTLQQITQDIAASERYVRELRAGMRAADKIAGDAATPARVRSAAIARLIAYWSVVRDEMDAESEEHDDE